MHFNSQYVLGAKQGNADSLAAPGLAGVEDTIPQGVQRRFASAAVIRDMLCEEAFHSDRWHALSDARSALIDSLIGQGFYQFDDFLSPGLRELAAQLAARGPACGDASASGAAAQPLPLGNHGEIVFKGQDV